jgi:hypothetical protein
MNNLTIPILEPNIYGHPLLKTNMFNYVPIKHKQTSFVSNGGKFKLYTVLNSLIFPTPTQPRISFERPTQSIPFKNAVDVALNGERFTLANAANINLKN